MLEAQKPAGTEKNLPPFSYEYYARSRNPQTGELVAFEPVNPIFELGIVKFNRGDVIHDVGAGTGGSTLNYRRFIPPEILPDVISIASEPSEESFNELKQNLGGCVQTYQLDGIKAVKSINANKVFLFHAIHLFSPKERVKFEKSVAGNLPDEGEHVLVTSFIEEDVPKEEQEVLIQPWMKFLFRRQLPQMGIDPRRILAKLKEQKLRMWKAEKYVRLVGKRLQVVYQSLNTMYCGLKSYEGINKYPVWIEHLLPGLDYETASEALTKSLRTVWERIGREEASVSPRNTLVIVAKKLPENGIVQQAEEAAKTAVDRELVTVA